jgi:hypothetical protein
MTENEIKTIFTHRLFCVIAALSFFTCEAVANDQTEDIRIAGDYLKIALPLYAFGLTLFDDDGDAKYQFIKSLVAAQAVVEILKPAVGERRPNDADDKSFPSGHAASAFSGAAFIHKRYGFDQAIVPYALATFVAYSRVRAKKHYTHDVVASAAIATAFVWVFTDEAITVEPIEGGAVVSYKIKF